MHQIVFPHKPATGCELLLNIKYKAFHEPLLYSLNQRKRRAKQLFITDGVGLEG